MIEKDWKEKIDLKRLRKIELKRFNEKIDFEEIEKYLKKKIEEDWLKKTEGCSSYQSPSISHQSVSISFNPINLV